MLHRTQGGAVEPQNTPPTEERKGGLKGLRKVGPSELMKERHRRENRERECPSNRYTQAERERGKEREREKEGGSLEETSNRHATGSNA